MQTEKLLVIAGSARVGSLDRRPAGFAALLSASPRPGRALRWMNFLRQALPTALQMIVVPRQIDLGKAHEARDENGDLRPTREVPSVAAAVQALGFRVRAQKSTRQPA